MMPRAAPWCLTLAFAVILLVPGASTAATSHPLGASPSAPTATWGIVAVSSHPPGLYDAAMAYDPVAHEVVMFGGFNNSHGAWNATKATWLYSNGTWRHLLTGVTPPARGGAFMAWDAADHDVLMFGGATSFSGSATYLNDTWKFAGGHWSQLHPATSPNPRAEGPAAYDQAMDAVVIGGGTGSLNGGGSGNDTGQWSFHAGNWTQYPSANRVPWTGPNEPMGYYPPRGELVEFGPCGANQASTMVFRHDNWSSITSTTEPTGSSCDGAMLWDPGLNVTVLLDNGYPYANLTTWGFHAGHWSNLTVGPQPPSLSGAAAAYDAADGYLLVFGGVSQSFVASTTTWALR